MAVALVGCQRGEPKSQGPRSFDLGRERPALTLFGAQPRDSLTAVASGDVNGDGTGDMLVGSFLANGPENDREGAGEVYVVLGSPSLGPTVDVVLSEH